MIKQKKPTSDSDDLANQNVTGPGSLDTPQTEKTEDRIPEEKPPGLENRNITAPEPSKPPQT